MDYNIELDLTHTGFYYLASDKTKSFIDEKVSQKKPLATFALKIPNRTLLNEPLFNKKKESICDQIIQQIVIGLEKTNQSSEADQKQKMQYSVTNVPCFDIC